MLPRYPLSSYNRPRPIWRGFPKCPMRNALSSRLRAGYYRINYARYPVASYRSVARHTSRAYQQYASDHPIN